MSTTTTPELTSTRIIVHYGPDARYAVEFALGEERRRLFSRYLASDDAPETAWEDRAAERITLEGEDDDSCEILDTLAMVLNRYHDARTA